MYACNAEIIMQWKACKIIISIGMFGKCIHSAINEAVVTLLQFISCLVQILIS